MRTTKFFKTMLNCIAVFFISTRTFVCFEREKKASFGLLIDRDWLGKVVLTLFKKLSNDIDRSGISFAKDGPISAKKILNSLASLSAPVFILLRFFTMFCFTNYSFHNSPSERVIFELEYLLWVVVVFGLTLNCLK